MTRFIDATIRNLTAIRKYTTTHAHANSALMNPPHVNGLPAAYKFESGVVTKPIDEARFDDATPSNDMDLMFFGVGGAVYSVKVYMITNLQEQPTPAPGYSYTWNLAAGTEWVGVATGSSSAGDILAVCFRITPTYDGIIHFKWSQNVAIEYNSMLYAGSYLVWTRTA
jgi:hypothetical protein